jgi:hypothetical protein
LFSSSFLFSSLLYIESIHCTSIHVPNRRRSCLHIPECPFSLPLLASVVSTATDQRFHGPTRRSHLYHHNNAQHATHLYRIRPFPPLPPLALPATSTSLPPQTVHRTLPQGNVDAHAPLAPIPTSPSRMVYSVHHPPDMGIFFPSSTLQPIIISHLTADPNTILVSGISTTDFPFPFHYFAFLELRNIASSQNPRSTALRSSLFSDQKYSPSLWSHLVRQSLLLLGHDFQTFIRRGQPLPTPASSTPPTDDTANKTQPAKAAPFPSTPIKYIKTAFKPFNSAGPGGQRPASPRHAFADVLASDGPLARAVDESTDEVAKVPELFRSVLRERRSPGRVAPSESLATVATTTTRVEAVSHPAWAKVSLPSLSPKWVDDIKNRIKGRVKRWTSGAPRFRRLRH